MEDRVNELTVEQLRTQFEEFEDSTNEARALSEKARDYRDLKQWTGEQLEELKRRKQAPLVIPKIPAKNHRMHHRNRLSHHRCFYR